MSRTKTQNSVKYEQIEALCTANVAHLQYICSTFAVHLHKSMGTDWNYKFQAQCSKECAVSALLLRVNNISSTIINGLYAQATGLLIPYSIVLSMGTTEPTKQNILSRSPLCSRLNGSMVHDSSYLSVSNVRHTWPARLWVGYGYG